MFFLLYKHTDDGVWMIFRTFPTTFRRFFKIVLKARRTFPNIFREFQKISEDFRRYPKTFKEDSAKMFRWYTNEFKYNLRDKRDISEIIDIFPCEDIISSHARISYRFYQFVTTRYTTGFKLVRALWLVNLAGRTLLHGPLKFKVVSVAKLFRDSSPKLLNLFSK